MNGTDNLIPFNKRTEEEQRRIATMGGKASGESRRRRKTMKENALMLLELANKNETYKDIMTSAGIPEDEQTNQMALIIAMLNKGLLGEVAAFNSLQATIGEKPVDKQVNVETDLEKYIKAVEDDKEF